MKHVVFPPQEIERLAELYRYEVLDTAPEKTLDDLVHLAAYICQAPIAVISLVDSDRQWFKSKIGLTATQTDRVVAFCAHTILGDELFVVPDTLEDKRFVENPLVTGDPNIRFYCGAPLTTPDGYRIGTLSVIDRVPRELSPEQLLAMRVLSRQVMDHLNLDRRHKELVTAVGERLKAEQALVASQTKFQRLSDCTSSGMYIYSGERFLYANPAAQTITGYSLEELKSLSLWDLVHPDFHEALKARVRAVEAGDQAPARLEFPIIAKDRQIRWLDFAAASIEFEGQQARIGTAIDITGRKQAEALNDVQRQVLEMISRNKPLLDVMHAVIQLIEALSDQGVCTILLVDPATGTLRHGATSTMPEDFCRAVDGAPVGPQVGSCGTAAYRKATVIVADIASDPLWEPWAEARRLILSLGFNACTSIPILDSRGEVLGTYAMYYKSARGPTRYEVELLQVSSFLLGIALDRQRNDEALRVSEERMEAILSNSPLMVFVKDRAGRYLFTNRMFEQRFRLSQRQAIGFTDAELFAPDQVAAFQANDEKVLRSGMPMEFEERARYDDGDHTSIVTKFPLRQPDGTVYAVGGIVTDITERRRTEEQARRWEQVFAKAGFGLAYGNIVDNTLVAVNEAFARQRGYTVDELVGKPIISIYAPEVREEMKARFGKIDCLGHLVYESVHQRKDGTTFPVLMEVTVVKDAQGRPISRVAYALDITKRKRAETSLAVLARQQAAVAALGQAALAGGDLQPLLEQTVTAVAATLGMEYCKVLKLLPDGVALELVAGVGWKPGLVGRATIDAGRHSQAGFTLLSKEPVIVEDFRVETRFSGPPLLHDHGVVSGMSVIIGGKDKPFGVLGVHTTRLRTFSTDDVHFLQSVANVLGEAIQRKQAEDALRTSEAQLRLSLEASRAGTWSWDAMQNVSTWDVRYHELYGFGPQEPVSYRTWIARVHPEDRPRVEDRVRLLLELGAGDVWHEEFRALHPVKGERWMEGLGRVERDKTGRAIRFAGINLDITERKQADEALRASEQRFALAVEGTQDGIWDWDVHTNEAYHSPRWNALLGITTQASTFHADAFFTRLHPDDVTLLKQAVREHFEHRVPFDVEIRLRHENGSYRWFRSTGQAIWDQQGRPVRMVGSLSDITERRQAVEALQDAYRRLKILTREVHIAQEQERIRLSRELHDEFGQLLSGLKLKLGSMNGSLSQKLVTTAKIARSIKEAEATVDRLFMSLREMVAALRPAVLDEFGLVAALQSMADDIRAATGLDCWISINSEKVHSQIGKELEGTLYRIAQELVTNVVRHAKATKASVTLHDANRTITLAVQDNGRGGQFAAPTRGYGLRGIRERAELLGGRVEIQSERLKGTTVTVAIPVEPSIRVDSAESAQRPARAKPRKRPYGKKA